MEQYAGIVSLELSSVCVVDPETRHVKAALSAMTVKTDRKDARGLAQLIRWVGTVRCAPIDGLAGGASAVAPIPRAARSGPSELAERRYLFNSPNKLLARPTR
jgi:hypothetical protein